MDLYYDECKTYKVDPSGACQFMAKSSSEVIAYSSAIEIQYWTYASVPKGMTYDEYINGKQPSYSSSTRAEKSSSSESDDMDESSGWESDTSQLIARLKQSSQSSQSA